ncbi:DUF4328 domain-containing protein [Micromonospora halotolerans]|uniref:DUF4328 domain-containing protein n=1 Tax=Micromonospora halotolerans TaxID=709879 RepID=A0ABZ0A0J9_9ACTN|nr:DUF4328 domain-containing protein [Micromonospora halotolerans]WNM41094.1 DUF4328 domain-containing protein [Micromonospora halotolerans]
MRTFTAHTLRTVDMHCQTCGDALSPADNECPRCGTLPGQPAVLPGVSTYAVRGLGTAAAIAVGAATVLYLPGALFSLVGLRIARAAAEQADRDLLMGAAVAEVLLVLPYLIALLVAAVLVIVWTWRARKNIEAFPGAQPPLGAGWAIAGWLVPIANFVVPARVMASVARNSTWRRSTPLLVGVWWAAWLVFTVGDRIVSRNEEQRYARLTEWPRNDVEFGTYVHYYQDALGPRLIPVVAVLVAGFSFVVLIRRISAAQQDRIARAVPVWPAHPGWPHPGAVVPAPGAAPGHPAQPVTGVPPQVATAPSVTSPQVPPGAGGTIGA